MIIIKRENEQKLKDYGSTLSAMASTATGSETTMTLKSRLFRSQSSVVSMR